MMKMVTNVLKPITKKLATKETYIQTIADLEHKLMVQEAVKEAYRNELKWYKKHYKLTRKLNKKLLTDKYS